MTTELTRRPMMRPAMVFIAAVSALALTACGSSSTSASSSSSKPAAASSSAQKTVPGAFGEIAAVNGQTIQVQSKQAQVAVNVTSATKIDTTASAAASDVVAGDCITARPAKAAATGASGSTTDSSGATAPTSIDAATVSISQPVNGACGGYGGAGGGGKGANAKKSSGAAPSGAPGAAGRGSRAFGAAGSVTSVNAGVIDVQSKIGSSTRAITVNTSTSTTYSKIVAADSSALVVGQCATAVGPTDSTGSITAKTISVTPPVSGACTRGGGQR
ncbi:MAG: DUF5666 domain-containing protein [Antricoccus sp.]